MRVMIELIFNFSISISDKALCDVSEILNRHKESVNSISSSSKLDFSKGTSFSKNNVYKNYGNRDNNIMRFGKSDYMEVNSLADQRHKSLPDARAPRSSKTAAPPTRPRPGSGPAWRQIRSHSAA